MAEKYGITETKDVMQLAVHLFKIFKAIRNKEGIPYGDIFNTIPIAKKAVDGYELVPREYGDLSPEEAKVLTGIFGIVTESPGLRKAFYGLSLTIAGIAEELESDDTQS